MDLHLELIDDQLALSLLVYREFWCSLVVVSNMGVGTPARVTR